jgi:hypothetical protein
VLDLTIEGFFIWHQIVGLILRLILYHSPTSQPIMNRDAFFLAPIPTNQLTAPVAVRLSLRWVKIFTWYIALRKVISGWQSQPFVPAESEKGLPPVCPHHVGFYPLDDVFLYLADASIYSAAFGMWQFCEALWNSALGRISSESSTHQPISAPWDPQLPSAWLALKSTLLTFP